MKQMLCSIVAGAVMAGHVSFPGPADAQGVRRTLVEGALWAAATGQLRLRGETWSGFLAGAPGGAHLDDAFGLSRVLLKGELHARDRLALVVELKSSLASRRTLPGGVRTGDEDQLDVQQAFAELGVATRRGRMALRGGRFELSLGRERLVGVGDWNNTRRTFEGASLRSARPGGELLAFWARPVTVRRRTPNITDSTRTLYGVQLAGMRDGHRGELYWLRSESHSATVNGTTGRDRRHTVGLRLLRPPSPGKIDVELEGALQGGSIGNLGVAAWMVAAVVGRSFGPGGLRLYAGLDAASGDDSTGGTVQTFSQLYPTGHSHLGYIDVQGRQNVVALSLGASLRPAATTSIAVDLFHFTRASGGDALYAADGAVIRPPGSGLPLAVGREIDLTVRYTLARGRVTLQAGASTFLPGPFLEQSGRSGNVGWGYGQVTASF